MPAKAPPLGPRHKRALLSLGRQIHQRRKGLKVSSVATAEAAGVSRMTLNRIERGESSVTMGAYLKVILVLGLSLELTDPKAKRQSLSAQPYKVPAKIPLVDYPQLKSLAWQLKATTQLSPQEALDIYERNWRHLDFHKMGPEEWTLLQGLLAFQGKERPLV